MDVPYPALDEVPYPAVDEELRPAEVFEAELGEDNALEEVMLGGGPYPVHISEILPKADTCGISYRPMLRSTILKKMWWSL